MSNSDIFKGPDSMFARRLKGLMKENSTTQQDLANTTQITRQAISQYLDGSVLPNIEKLYLISEFFDVSADYLLGTSNHKNYEKGNTAALPSDSQFGKNWDSVYPIFQELTSLCLENSGYPESFAPIWAAIKWESEYFVSLTTYYKERQRAFIGRRDEIEDTSLENWSDWLFEWQDKLNKIHNRMWAAFQEIAMQHYNAVAQIYEKG